MMAFDFKTGNHGSMRKLKTAGLEVSWAKKRKRVARSSLKRGTVDAATSVKLSLKMQGFQLAVPTVHTQVSFSVIHLLTAVRKAMIDPHAEDDAGVHGNDQGETTAKKRTEFYYLKGNDSSDFILTNSKNLPVLTLNEIVEHVVSIPMDPCILQTQEPLHDLVRGVLEMFSPKRAPRQAKGWKPLTFYHKSSKCWSWIGPITFSSCNVDEEDVSSEAWNLCHNMLVKLVNAFAIWFKSFQERLRQVESLPAPSLVLMQPRLGERERLGSIRCRIHTLSPSSEEVRAYFHKEKTLRYLVQDRAFSYTTRDGRKSAVAPLRRRRNNPLYRAGDHVMLRADRPPHINILCLMRDAAVRLPGSFGTKADVCTLVQDSQYMIVGEVSDEHLGQVVYIALSFVFCFLLRPETSKLHGSSSVLCSHINGPFHFGRWHFDRSSCLLRT